MSRPYLATAGVLLALAAGNAPAQAWAQTAGASASIGGTPEISLRGGLWSHDRDLDQSGAVAVGAVEARLATAFSAHVDAYVEGRLQADSTGQTDSDLREGWVRFTNGGAKLTVGRQIVVWGRADRLNPTDVIGSRDYTQLLANDDEQRRGAFLVQASYGAGPWTVSALWLPEFRPNRFPFERSTPGVDVLEEQHPRDRNQFALHLDHAGEGPLDWSISYFDGVGRTPNIVALPVPAGAPAGSVVAVQQQYPDIQVVGADLAGVRGQVGFRAETAYTHVRGPDTPFRQKDTLWTVVGVDRTFDNGWNVNLQYSLRYVFDYADPSDLANPVVRAVALQSAVLNNQLDRRQNGVSLRAAHAWMNDTLQFEVTALTDFETHDLALRPKLRYAFSDKLSGTLGADVFTGPKLSFFGRVRDASAVYAQLVYGF